MDNFYDYIDNLASLDKKYVLDNISDQDKFDYAIDLVPYLFDDFSSLNNRGNIRKILYNCLNSCILDGLSDNLIFLKLVYANYDDLKYNFRNVTDHFALRFDDYLRSIGSKLEYDFLTKINNDSFIYLCSLNKIPYDEMCDLISNVKKRSRNYLLNNKIYSLSDLSLESLMFISNDKLPYKLIDNSFIKRISHITNTKNYRLFINRFEKNNNPDIFTNSREKYYENQINSYDQDYQMLDIYKKIYLELKDKDINSFKEVNDILEKYLNDFDLYSKAYELYGMIKTGKLKEFLIKESNLELSDMIIDYHFQDIYYNLLIDLKMLLNDKLNNLDIYQRIANLDNLSYEEKLRLHKDLKKNNFKEIFYDDMRSYKDKIYKEIATKTISQEKLEKLKNKNYSKKYGVNVYELSGIPFKALVKSVGIPKKDTLILEDIRLDESSFSLISDEKLDTFKDPRGEYNLVFDNIPYKQIIHMYPSDSFTIHNQRNGEKNTNYINYVMPLDKFIKRTFTYNEILMQEKNSIREDDLNNRLSSPRPFAILCYDYITKEDIISAKENNLDIVLVYTEDYINRNNRKTFREEYLTRIQDNDHKERRK